MFAGHLGYKVGKFCHFTQNVHIYDRHSDSVDELLLRSPLDKNPKLILKENKNFYDYDLSDFIIEDIEGIKKLSNELELAI
jgi:thymidylate synthase